MALWVVFTGGSVRISAVTACLLVAYTAQRSTAQHNIAISAASAVALTFLYHRILAKNHWCRLFPRHCLAYDGALCMIKLSSPTACCSSAALRGASSYRLESADCGHTYHNRG